MTGPLDHLLTAPAAAEPEQLLLLTTDRDSGKVTGAVALGSEWDTLLGALVLDVGRRARSGPDA